MEENPPEGIPQGHVLIKRKQKEVSMLRRTNDQKHDPSELPNDGNEMGPSTLLTVMGNDAKLEGKFDIADSIEIECAIGGELKVGGKLVIGKKGAVHADVTAHARSRLSFGRTRHFARMAS